MKANIDKSLTYKMWWDFNVIWVNPDFHDEDSTLKYSNSLSGRFQIPARTLWLTFSLSHLLAYLRPNRRLCRRIFHLYFSIDSSLTSPNNVSSGAQISLEDIDHITWPWSKSSKSRSVAWLVYLLCWFHRKHISLMQRTFEFYTVAKGILGEYASNRLRP